MQDKTLVIVDNIPALSRTDIATQGGRVMDDGRDDGGGFGARGPDQQARR